MKRKLLTAVIISALMTGCGWGTSSKKGKNDEATTKTEQTQASVYTLDSLLMNAAELADDTVTVVGYMTHTCKFSGRRCFIIGEDPNTTFRVEAKGKIGGFNRELIGSKLAIKGILKERRLTEEYIDQWEEDVRDKAEDGSVESCGAETKNFKSMRAWMKKNNKDYFSTYSMDGLSYDIIEE